MFLIQKAVRKDISAKYNRDEAHLWQRAWDHKRSHLKDCSIDEAIKTFNKLTTKVRSTPYRLITLNSSSTTLAAINTSDAYSFKKYSIFAVSFTKQKTEPKPTAECFGAIAPESGGMVVGHARIKSNEVKKVVDEAANTLSHIVASHRVTTRYNSDGRSGGAFLITSPTNGILSNSDIGITYSEHTQKIELLVTSKFLSDKSLGNKLCPWSKMLDHESEHNSVQEAAEMLINICKKATKEEAELLAA